MSAEFYFFLGAVLMVVLFLYLGVHTQVADALDSRNAKIKAELDEAAHLRDEALALVQSFVAKTAEAEQQAAAIIAQAKAEAEAMAKTAQAQIEEYVARRTKQAQDKIALAEAQATADLRSAVADAAVKAAEAVLKTSAAGAGGTGFVDQGIASVKALMN